MTFEEFFAKKKIDLTALKKADNSLYEEFKKHYSAMGAKSFDHTKKFWFNKLRKSYQLTEVLVEKKEVQQPVIREQQLTGTETATNSAGFKPRFKAKVNPLNAPTKDSDIQDLEKINEASTNTEPDAKPAGFKPRFKAGLTKPAASEPKTDPTATELQSAEQQDIKATKEAATETSNSDLPTEATKKPAGFKPRFKAGVTKPAASELKTDQPAAELQSAEQQDHKATTEAAKEISNSDLPTEATNKPAGFKPRFKAGVTKVATPEPKTDQTVTEQQSAEQQDHNATTEAAKEISNSDLPTEATKKPAGFKPRFKAGVTKVATPQPKTDQTEAELQSAEQQDHKATTEAAKETSNSDLPTEATNKPAGFKPRFKAGVTKVATPEPKTDQTATEQQSAEQQDHKATTEAAEEISNSDLSTEATNKPAGFKPRFKAGVTKVKNKDNE